MITDEPRVGRNWSQGYQVTDWSGFNMSQPEKGSWCSPSWGHQTRVARVTPGIRSWKPLTAGANWRQCLGNSMVSTNIQEKKTGVERIVENQFVIFKCVLSCLILEPEFDEFAPRGSAEELTMVATVGHWAGIGEALGGTVDLFAIFALDSGMIWAASVTMYVIIRINIYICVCVYVYIDIYSLLLFHADPMNLIDSNRLVAQKWIHMRVLPHFCGHCVIEDNADRPWVLGVLLSDKTPMKIQ